MQPDLVAVLRCPTTGQTLRLSEQDSVGGRVRSGMLVSADGTQRYRVRDYIPRFVGDSNYADNFGMQWNRFARTQLDSFSGQPISAERFWKATGWSPADLSGRWVLDVGCGSGRFAEVALEAGAKVIALDYSSAVDACYANLAHHPGLHVIQGDIYALPFAQAFFPFVYSLGVLQHTPDVERSFAALPPLVAPGGRLCVDYYWRRVRTLLHTKYILRPFTRRLPREKLFAFLEKAVPVLLPISQALGRVPVLSPVLKRAVPIVDYTGIYDLDDRQLREWALLDTFDMLSPRYDNPQTARTVRRWFERAGFVDVAVFHEGHLVARGRKPA
jgi:SAM-dependent methyltransferase